MIGVLPASLCLFTSATVTEVFSILDISQWLTPLTVGVGQSCGRWTALDHSPSHPSIVLLSIALAIVVSNDVFLTYGANVLKTDSRHCHTGRPSTDSHMSRTTRTGVLRVIFLKCEEREPGGA